jgi:hypothetical protein
VRRVNFRTLAHGIPHRDKTLLEHGFPVFVCLNPDVSFPFEFGFFPDQLGTSQVIKKFCRASGQKLYLDKGKNATASGAEAEPDAVIKAFRTQFHSKKEETVAKDLKVPILKSPLEVMYGGSSSG